MGRKPVGQRQYLLLHLAVGLIGLLLTSGCQHIQTEVTATENVPALVDACRRNLDFDCAERLLAPNRYPATGPADPHLIYLAGLVAVDARNPGQNYQTAGEYFLRLVTDHAESPLATDAVAWLGLIDAINSQSETIDRMKTANTRMQQEIDSQKTHRRRMEKRLEQLKAVDLSTD